MPTIISPKEELVNSKPVFSFPLKVVFFGTPEFADIIFKVLLQNPAYEMLAAVCSPDKPKGRGGKISPPPVKETALENKIRILQPQNLKDAGFILELKNLNADIFLTAAFGKILPKEILELPPLGALNVHPSLLPKYRGPSPIQTAIFNGDSKTGVSIILMTEKMDAGPVVLQKEIEIAPKETSESLHSKLAKLAGQILPEAIELWKTGQDLENALDLKIAKAQNESEATYTKIIAKQDGLINWQKSADEIERQIRAFFPWPGAFGKLNGKVFKILEAEMEKKNSSLYKREAGRDFVPGKIFLLNETVAVACGQDHLIIKKIQPEGKNPLTDREFLNGYKDLLGLTFE